MMIPPVSTARQQVLAQVAAAIVRLPTLHVVRVGVDGIDGAGKTMFADELAQFLITSGRTVIRATVDSFHNPRATRYRRGRESPEGYFLDSYAYAQLRAVLLDPLGPGGSGRYRTAIFDYHADAPVVMPEAQAAGGDILVFDGIFLHRPELRSCWDYSIFLEISPDIACRRCAARDGGSPDPHAPENCRYVMGQAIYLRSCAPKEHATVVIDNEDIEAPWFVPQP